jgi:hypothetical protein
MEDGRHDLAGHLSAYYWSDPAGVSFYERTQLADTIADTCDNAGGGATDDICGAAVFAKAIEEVAVGVNGECS